MSWVHTVLATARRLGVVQAEVLARAGIAAEALSQDRWPVDHITRLWRAAAQMTGDPGFGLKVGSHAGPASFNVLSILLQASASLREAIEATQKYQRLISDGGRLQLLPGDTASWLVYHPRQGDLAFSPHQIEAVLATLVTFGRWVTERSQPPQLVRFSHEKIGPLAGYREVFGCPIEFDQVYNGLLLDNASLDHPLPQADASMAQLHEHYAAAKLQALSQKGDLPRSLQAWIAHHLGTCPPTRALAAKYFAMTERTLARRLRDHGSSFTALVDAARRSQALEQMERGNIPIADVARNVGYTDLSPFYRAFQRWTGSTPAQWRSGEATSRKQRGRAKRRPEAT